MKEKNPEKLPVVGDVYSKRTRFLQDWIVTDIYKSHVDGVIYARLKNPLMGEKNVGAAELVRKKSDWTKKTVNQSPVDPVLDFSLEQQHGDSDEFISAIWIDVAAVEAGNFTLYLDNSGTTLAASGVTQEGGWYKLTNEADWTNIYAQGAPNVHGNFNFGVRYEITDISSDGSLVAKAVLAPATTHTLEIDAVTDPATLLINTITSSDSYGNTVTITDNDAGPGTDFSVEASGNTTLTVNVTLTKDEDANANNERDYDGSEAVTQVIIDNVPAGVTIDNAVYIGNFPSTHPGVTNTGRWLLKVVDPVGDNLNGLANFDVVYNLIGSADKFAPKLEDLELFIRVVTEDSNNDSENIASDSWKLSTTDVFNGDNSASDPAATIDTWQDDPAFVATEDTSFLLSDTLMGTISGSSDFAITITGFPAGTVVTGMELTVVDGVETWTASGSGGDAALQALKASIQITLPNHWNNNSQAGNLQFQSTLTTYTDSGDRNDSTALVTQSVTPVTDQAIMTISNNGTLVPNINPNVIDPRVINEDASVTFSVAITNPNDGAFSQVLPDVNTADGNLYVQLTETDMAGGTLWVNGVEITKTPVGAGVAGAAGDYYVITGVNVGESPQLEYRPPENGSG
ncbi:hypothetical protein, partial [uncultured Kiloniella sp.]|uniref:hypothetical protein n=1 Tax=uncultured Kiloniella sp. TaxID=1133091 RepID=UPI00261389B7